MTHAEYAMINNLIDCILVCKPIAGIYDNDFASEIRGMIRVRASLYSIKPAV